MKLSITADWHLEDKPLWVFPTVMPEFDVTTGAVLHFAGDRCWRFLASSSDSARIT